MFHPADGENSGASLGGSVMRNGIRALVLDDAFQPRNQHALDLRRSSALFYTLWHQDEVMGQGRVISTAR